MTIITGDIRLGLSHEKLNVEENSYVKNQQQGIHAAGFFQKNVR
ncbi:hypothetical protein [Celerinatantimonas yamalensis]|uniref:Uncharacterized protein n=1 Tax=Celerinatantimonas yamalensis TaxID=559956 RepID=A0ABW9GBG7_9GAMM